MLLDYLGFEIKVGDYVVYGAGRGCLEYGLVTDIAFDERNLGYNHRRTGKIKLARLIKNQKFVWDSDAQTGERIDLGGWKVNRVSQSNAVFTVVLPEDRILNNDNFLKLREFKLEILSGKKIVGNEGV
jgi:hypothetical protein